MNIKEKVSFYLQQILKNQKVSGLTTDEEDLYELALENHIIIHKGKDWLDKEDISLNDSELGDFMVSMDKQMLAKACEHMSKSIYNYRRKLFGIGETPNPQLLIEFITNLMKEQIPIQYPNYETISKFWGQFKDEMDEDMIKHLY